MKPSELRPGTSSRLAELPPAPCQPRLVEHAVSCLVRAQAVVRTPLANLPELRRQPGPIYQAPLPAAFLKHADEQTVIGLAAVLEAIRRAGMETTDFRTWGVLGAPRFLGRLTMPGALQRFALEGAWGVSPHLIPHRSLHAISGTISQALKIHGPNFGVGGGPGSAGEALLAGAAMLGCDDLPGVWVVVTCLDPEPAPNQDGAHEGPCEAVGLALALQTASAPVSGPFLRLVSSEMVIEAGQEAPTGTRLDLPQLEKLLGLHPGACRTETMVVQWLDSCLRIEIGNHGSNPASRMMLPETSGRESGW